MEDTEKIALEFSRQLQRELGKKDFKLMVKFSQDNTIRGICVSHDFCDANMPMLEAYKAIKGYEPQVNSNPDTHVWNDAWTIAVNNNFYYELNMDEDGNISENWNR